MLRTTIDTRDEATGKELPIPADLRAKVERAASLAEAALKRLGQKFDIDARWHFERGPAEGLTVGLTFSTPNGGRFIHRFSNGDLDTDELARRNLWSPLWHLGDVLSEELDREFARIRRGLEAIATDGGE